jgi:hypothetical protein
MDEKIIFPSGIDVPQDVVQHLSAFLNAFVPYEIKNSTKLNLHFDEKSRAFYITCHIDGRTLVKFCDTDASLDGDDEDDIYKLNREITEDQDAFKEMVSDALRAKF